MGRIAVAFRAFFAALFTGGTAERLRAALDGQALPKITGKAVDDAQRQPAESATRTAPAPEPPPKRSEAITLLAALQREARLVDLVQQPLDQFTDQQIGSAARNVLRDSAGVLQRFFGLQPVLAQEEESPAVLPTGYDPGRFRLLGNVSGSGPFNGKLAHQGWQATTCNLPAWTGSKDSALVIAPAEIEV